MTSNLTPRRPAKMSDNEIRALNFAYEDWCARRMVGLTDVDPFEFFCADQFLKPYSMTDAEIISGLVDNGQDGGIDAFYFFLNRVLVDDNTFVDSRTAGEINLVIMQFKESDGFSPIDIDKMYFFTDDLLDIGKQPERYHTAYHEKLSKLIRVFKDKYDQLSGTEIKVTIEYYFITRNDTEPGRDAVESAENVCKRAKKHFRRADVKPFNFITGTRLYLQVQIRPLEKKLLPFFDYVESAEGYIGLVYLKEFYDFIKIDNGPPTVINERFLEENVRGYQIDTPVNLRIGETLGTIDSPEFWLLNNGITILTPLADPKRSKVLEINDPQIVNGLQTSRKIFDHYNKATQTRPDPDNRRIIVKVIQTDEPRTRDEVIRATNNQNKMPSEALISTYRVQRMIENHFHKNGFYYDRRKGHYKAMQMQAAQIISVPDLVQAVVSIIVARPDDARGRPLDYIKEPSKRWQVFGTTEDEELEGVATKKPLDLDVYLSCVKILRKIDEYFRRRRIDTTTRRNTRFYLARAASVAAFANAYFQPYHLVTFDVDGKLTDNLLDDCFRRVNRIYKSRGGDDDAAKSRKMSDSLSRSLIKTYSPPNRKRR
jgi:hypothetical protein